MKTAIAKLRDGREVEVKYRAAYSPCSYPLYPLRDVTTGRLDWTIRGEYISSFLEMPQDIMNIDDVLHDLGLPDASHGANALVNASYVVKTLANTKWSELPEAKLRAMYDLSTGE